MPYNRLLASLLCLGLLSSCALHSPSTGAAKYQRAVVCYEKKKYHEAMCLFKEALPQLRGKREEASTHFYQAYCNFHQKEYVQSADGFQYFWQTFLRDPRVEEAVYMQGHALYLAAPVVQLDQALTKEGVDALHSYLARYPKGAYASQASDQLEELTGRLADKALGIAKGYYQREHYQAAVVALENFQKDFPTSSCSEEAAYLKAAAQCQCCKAAWKKTAPGEALHTATEYYQAFLANYPGSRYIATLGKMYASLGL